MLFNILLLTTAILILIKYNYIIYLCIKKLNINIITFRIWHTNANKKLLLIKKQKRIYKNKICIEISKFFIYCVATWHKLHTEMFSYFVVSVRRNISLTSSHYDGVPLCFDKMFAVVIYVGWRYILKLAFASH